MHWILITMLRFPFITVRRIRLQCRPCWLDSSCNGTYRRHRCQFLMGYDRNCCWKLLLCAKIDDGIAAAVFSTSTGVLQITAPPPPFVTEWDTENTTGAATGSGVITLPLISAGSYNIRADWGDGQVDKISAWDDTRKPTAIRQAVHIQ